MQRVKKTNCSHWPVGRVYIHPLICIRGGSTKTDPVKTSQASVSQHLLLQYHVIVSKVNKEIDLFYKNWLFAFDTVLGWHEPPTCYCLCLFISTCYGSWACKYHLLPLCSVNVYLQWQTIFGRRTWITDLSVTISITCLWFTCSWSHIPLVCKKMSPLTLKMFRC